MILQKEDREFLEKVSAVCKHEKAVVYDVMRSFIFVYGIELRKKLEKKETIAEITIPFLCKLLIDYEKELTAKGVVCKVNMTATPQGALIDEINNVVGNYETITEKQLIKQIEGRFTSFLHIGEDNLNE